MLQAVLFDLDNTLVERDRAFRACVQAQFGDAALQAQLFALDQDGRGDRARLFSFWEQHSGEPMDQSQFGKRLAAQLQPDRNLILAMRIFSKTLQLGLITNGGSQTQRKKICAAHLDEVFPANRIWISDEVGVAKPDAAIFIRACAALGIAPANCLYVGDHEQDDLRGAINAGLRARLVDSVLNADMLNRLLDEEARR